MKTVCMVCGDAKEHDSTNVGETAKVTGFYPLFTHAGEIAWFCPTHATILALLMQPVVKMLRTGKRPDLFEWLHWPSVTGFVDKLIPTAGDDDAK